MHSLLGIAPARAVAFCSAKQGGLVMKTRKTMFHRALSMLLTAAMVVTLFTIAAPAEAQAAGLSFKGNGKSTVKITDSKCWVSNTKMAVNYIKYKPSVTGTVTLKFDCNSSYSNSSLGYVVFCDKNKKAIGQKDEIWRNDYSGKIYNTTTYGVKKNTTYYFAVRCNAGTKITATTKAVKDSSASSKSKAKTLSKGKKVTGVIAYGDSKADWYKIKLTQSAKLELYYLANTNGTNEKNGFKITFYNKDGKVFSGNNNGKKVSAVSKVTRLYPEDGWYISLGSGGTKFDLPSGTYYIKVERMSKASSGSYTLKWTTF